MVQRKLAAIMFSDIAGYSSLLKETEKKAFEALRKNQRIHKRLIKKYKGRWLKEMESGSLVIFPSNIDAIICALSIQKATEGLDIPLRIGIHQGDVVFEKKDVLGDGVNIASRIHSVAKANDIIISETVYHDVRNKQGLELEFYGEHTLKGVTEPIGIYKVGCSDESVLDFTLDTGELVRPLGMGRTTVMLGIIVIALLAYALYYFLPKTESTSGFKKGILIMPFDNYIDTDTLDYFVAGMHDQLIGKMGRIGALRVIPKTTSRAYKNSDQSIPEMAEELGVNAVIETAVLCTGDSICLEVKLKSANEGKELWVKEFHEETSRILNLYNKITKEISDEIDIKLRPQEELLLTEYRNVDPDAIEAYMRGYSYWDYLHPDSTKKAIEYFQQAIDIDPDWADPYAGLALALSIATQGGFGGWLPKTATLPKIYNNMNKALELDPNSASAHFTKAVKATWTEFDWEKAEAAFKRCIELNPSDARCRAYYAHLLSILRRSDETIHQAKLAAELDPLNPTILSLCAVAMFEGEEYQLVIDLFEKALEFDARFRLSGGSLRESYYFIGGYDKWFEIWMKYVCWDDKFKAILTNTYYEQGHIATINELLRLHKQYETEFCFMKHADYIHWYMKLEDFDKVKVYIEKELDWMEELVDKSIWWAPYHSTNSWYKILKDNPRYISLLKKMNLPVD
jgi:TolB-like protein/Tfp pilus assembly protein PilF